MLRVGILTSGGDCQGLNAAIRGVAKALYEAFDEVEIYGFIDGYKGLIGGDYRRMKPGGFLRHPHPGGHRTGNLPAALQAHARGGGGWGG